MDSERPSQVPAFSRDHKPGPDLGISGAVRQIIVIATFIGLFNPFTLVNSLLLWEGVFDLGSKVALFALSALHFVASFLATRLLARAIDRRRR